MDYDGRVPGGDVSDLTLRKIRELRDSMRRDRLAVAALYAHAFPTTEEALAKVEALIAGERPAGGRTRSAKALSVLDADTREWAAEIRPALEVIAAMERATRGLESADKAGGGDSSPAVDEPDDLLLRAIADPGQFVARDLKFNQPRWEGDSYAVEPLYRWQARAVTVALELREIEARRG